MQRRAGEWCRVALLALGVGSACSFPSVELTAADAAAPPQPDASSSGDTADIESGGFDAQAAPWPADAPSALPETLPDDTGSDGPAAASTYDACAPDLTWCNTHCGTGPDNCDVQRACSVNCPTGSACGANNACQCQPQSGWCNARCGQTTDNCNNPIDCGSCDAGETCVNHACGCTPDGLVKTCASLECGQATNNCGQTVNCGVSGTAACPQGQVCLQAGSCCAPTDPCVGRCGGITVTNNCAQATQCSAACANGQECTSTFSCCTPNGSCSGPCLDSCGAQDSTCCPAPAPDAGPPDSGSTCAANGAECASGAACCSGACAHGTGKSKGGVCAAWCVAPPGGCIIDADCCVPSMCRPPAPPGMPATCK